MMVDFIKNGDLQVTYLLNVVVKWFLFTSSMTLQLSHWLLPAVDLTWQWGTPWVENTLDSKKHKSRGRGQLVSVMCKTFFTSINSPIFAHSAVWCYLWWGREMGAGHWPLTYWTDVIEKLFIELHWWPH